MSDSVIIPLPRATARKLLELLKLKDAPEYVASRMPGDGHHFDQAQAALRRALAEPDAEEGSGERA